MKRTWPIGRYQALERDRLELAAEIAARGPTQASKAGSAIHLVALTPDTCELVPVHTEANLGLGQRCKRGPAAWEATDLKFGAHEARPELKKGGG